MQLFKVTDLMIKFTIASLLLATLVVGFNLRYDYYQSADLPTNPAELSTRIPDENTYFRQAILIHEMGLPKYLAQEESMIVATVNPLYLSLFLSSDNPIQNARLANLLLSTLTILMVYLLGYLAFSSHFVGLVSSVIIAHYKSFIFMSPTMLTEPLFFFLIITSVIVLILAFKKGSTPLFFLCGILFAVSTLTRSILQLYPFFLLFVGLCFFALKKVTKNLMVNLLVLTLGFILVILPVAIKNQVLFNSFSLFNGSGAVWFVGSRADTEGDEPPYRGKTYDIDKITDNPFSVEGEKLLRQAAIKNIKEHPFGYLYWGVKKIGRITIGNTYYWYTDKNFILSPNLAYQTTIVILGLFGFFYFYKNRLVWPIFLTVLYLVLIHTPFLVNTRYGFPLFPFWSVSASALLVEYLTFNFYEQRKKIIAFQIVPFGIIMLIFLYVTFGFKLLQLTG